MPRPATAYGRQLCRSGTVKASTVTMSQPVAITSTTGHGSSSAAGNGGGWGAGSAEPFGSPVIATNLADRQNVQWPWF